MKTQPRDESIFSVPPTPKMTMRVSLDVDVLTWLKKDGRGYQSRANRMLRELMLKDKTSA